MDPGPVGVATHQAEAKRLVEETWQLAAAMVELFHRRRWLLVNDKPGTVGNQGPGAGSGSGRQVGFGNKNALMTEKSSSFSLGERLGILNTILREPIL